MNFLMNIKIFVFEKKEMYIKQNKVPTYNIVKSR